MFCQGYEKKFDFEKVGKIQSKFIQGVLFIYLNFHPLQQPNTGVGGDDDGSPDVVNRRQSSWHLLTSLKHLLQLRHLPPRLRFRK